MVLFGLAENVNSSPSNGTSSYSLTKIVCGDRDDVSDRECFPLIPHLGVSPKTYYLLYNVHRIEIGGCSKLTALRV